MEKENIYLFVATFFWALGLIVGKFVSAEFPPITLTFFRYLIAGTGMGLVHFFKEKEFFIEKKDMLYIFILSFLGIVLNGLLFFKGISLTSSINTSILSSSTPIVVCILGVVFFKENINIKNIMAIIFSIGGILLLFTDGKIDSLLDINFNKGDLIILGAIISNGIYIVGSKKILKKYSSTKILTYLFAFSVLILLPGYIYESRFFVISEVSNKAILSLIYMAIFSSLIAFLLQQKGIKKMGPIKASLYTNLIPVYSIILSFLILGEKIKLNQLVAMLLIMLGIFINLGGYRSGIKKVKNGLMRSYKRF